MFIELKSKVPKLIRDKFEVIPSEFRVFNIYGFFFNT